MTARSTHPDQPDRDPELSAAESEAIGRRIHALALTVEAPASLRERLAEAQPSRPSRARARLGRPRFALPVVAGGLAAVIAVVAVLAGVGGGGGSAAPSVADAAALALARPTAAAPATDAASTQLPAQVGGVAFPNYTYQWPAWKAAGTRHDTLAGRATTTVVYRGPQGDVGYTIVDGKPLAEPDGARTVAAAGVKLKVFKKDGVTVVTWQRGGHTCVLAGRGQGVEPQLVKFATWA
jgi:hypothetical protein